MKIKLQHHIHRPFRHLGGRSGINRNGPRGSKHHGRIVLSGQNYEEGLHLLEDVFGVGDGYHSPNPEMAVY